MEYNIDKLLYLLIDRLDNIVKTRAFLWCKSKYNSKIEHKDHDLLAYIYKKEQ